MTIKSEKIAGSGRPVAGGLPMGWLKDGEKIAHPRICGGLRTSMVTIQGEKIAAKTALCGGLPWAG